MRADLLARRADLLRDHERAIRADMSENRPPEAPGLVRQLSDIEDEIGASEFAFTFEALGGQDYRRLLADHPPRREDAQQQLGFNADTFPAALIAASAVDPEISNDDATHLVERLSDSQFSKLWNAALSVNIGDDTAPKSVRRFATGGLSETSSTTASPEESPEASS
jgi:hypothetical protein